jgi:cytochrome c oxidase subunit 3
MPYTDAIQGPPPPPIAESEWGGGGEPGKRRRASLTGIYVLFAAITKFFAGLTSALVVRRGLGSDWNGIPLPPILWLNTVLLLASSAALETARRALHAGERASVNRWWTPGTVLGLLFMAGQYIAWQEAAAGGITVASSPGGSFFFLFTVAHAVHVLGGVAALGYIEVQALRLQLGPGKRTGVEVARLYWHFLAGLWVYLMLLFYFWG